MTPEDRALLLSLRQQQGELQHSLEHLNAQLGALEARANASAPEVSLPPLPVEPELPPIPPPFVAATELPPIPTPRVVPTLPPIPIVATPKPSFEFQFGRLLIRISALIFVIALVFFATWIDFTYHIYERLGAGGKLGLMGLLSVLVLAAGQRLERKKAGLLFIGRTLIAAGLGGLYVTIYASYYVEPLRVIHNPISATILLLLWSIYVLLLADRKKSQFLALFAITLAYVSTAINPVGSFSMAADLILAATAVVFLLRTGWAALSTVSVIGTYYALLRRLVIDENGELVLDTSRTIHYWPYAIYLVCAWFIFTLAIILTTAPTFRGGKRLAFVSLNNGAMAGLLALTAYISGYGTSAVGWTLLDTGLLFLVTSRFAGFAEVDPVDIMAAYAAQGLALFTAGIIVVFTGITRAFLLLVETLLLGIAAAFSDDRILTISTYVAAFFATLFSIWEIAVNAHHPWLLGFGGAAIMFINAWSSRGYIKHSPLSRSTIVVSTSCYCILAIALIFTSLSTELSDSMLPPALALTALALTFSIYFVAIFELPPLAQILLIAAQILVLFPVETGEELPWWTTGWVAAVTLLLVTWWSRQRVTRSGSWTIPLTFVYALALVDLAVQATHPYLSAQGWMVGASLLSVVFLVYGAFTRVWSVAAAGQILLFLSLFHFFFPPQSGVFPWSWWAAAVPVMVIYVTARAARQWLDLFTEITDSWRKPLRVIAFGYQLLALVALIHWVFGVVPEWHQVAAFLFFGTLLLSSNVRHDDAFGIRCSFVLSAIGMWLYLDNVQALAHFMATFFNGLAMLLFLIQPTLLRHEGKSLVTRLESWTLIILSVGTCWLFTSAWVWTRLNPHYLTLGWAAFALFLFLFGLIVHENRMRWCGLAILFAAIVRVFCSDLWGLSTGYRVLTFFLLAFIAFGIGFILLRRDNRRNTL